MALVMVVNNETSGYLAQVLPPGRELWTVSELLSHAVGNMTVRCYTVDGTRSDPTRTAMEIALQEDHRESNPI